MNLLRWYLTLFGIACLIPASFGQAVKGKVVAGFGGYYRIGKSMPVKVYLDNSGPDLTGEIVVQNSRSYFYQAVSLPSPSSKTIVFYIVPSKYVADLEVKLFAGGKVVTVFDSPVQRVPDEDQIVIKSSSLKSPLQSSNSFALPGRGEKAVFLDPQDFPEFWSDYDAVNSVILDTSDLTHLSELQRTALSRWTFLGGNVTLFNPSFAASEPGEQGKIKPFRTSLGLGSFGGIEKSLNNKQEIYQPSLLDLDEEIFKTLRIRNPMPGTGVFLPILVFLFAYGSIQVFFLCISKKFCMDKLWSFALVPAFALVISAMCPLASGVVNGGNALVRQYSVFHVFANSMDSFVTYDLSLLFPGKGDYRLKPATDSSYLVQSESDDATELIYYEFEGKGSPSAVFSANLAKTKLLSIASFTGKGLFFILRDLDSIKLANRSGFPLRSCSFIRDGISLLIGDIPAGRELRLKPEAVNGDLNFSSGRSIGSRMLSKTVDVYQTETLAGTTGDCVICEMAGSIPGLEGNTRLSYSGDTAVIYHLGNLKGETGNWDPK